MSVSMLSEQLVKAGVDTEVFATTANGINELPVQPGQPVNVDGVTVTYFKRLTKDHSHFSPALIKKLWKEAPGFRLVHIHAWWNLVSVLSCLVALMRKVPVLLSARGTLSPYSFQNKNIGSKWVIHHLLGKFLLRKCHFHATSEWESDAIRKLVHPKSVFIIPNFVKLPVQTQLPQNAPSSILRLIFFSRIEEKKGLDILLAALAMVPVPYYLTIAGDGDKNYIEHLKTTACNHHIDDKINWIGFQHENKFGLLHNHDLFVLPSYDENFGNTVIESLSVGTPVLISEQVGLADYVQDNKLGWLCQTNPVSISEAINKIDTDRAELSRIRKAAPAIIYEDFNEGALVKKYITMYNQLIKQ